MNKLLFVTALFLWGIFYVHPQESRPGGQQASAPLHLSPREAVDLAINNNLLLQTARISSDITRRRSGYAWNQFLPTVGVNGTLARSNFASSFSPGVVPLPNTGSLYTYGWTGGIINPDIIVPSPVDLPRWNMLGGLSATLDFSFALVEGIRSLRLDYEAGLLTLDKARLQLEQAVLKMYNGILLLQANMALHAEGFDNAQQQAAIAEANFQAGLAPRLNWLQAQVAVENMRPITNELDNNMKSLKGNFAHILGLPYDTEIELEPIHTENYFIPQDLAGFISRSAAMGKPDIMELQANIVTLQSRRKALAFQQYTPFLRLGWNLSSTFTGDPWTDSLFSGSNWNRGGNLSITLGMNFNGLFSFTREGQQFKDMDANIQINNIMLANMIRETELEIFNKINSMETARTTVAAQQAAVDLAEMTYNLTEEAYRAGHQDFQSVRNSALALERAKLQLSTLYFNFLNDMIDLEYSLGVPFGSLLRRSR